MTSNDLVVEEARIDVGDTDQRHRRPVRQVQSGIAILYFLACDDLLDRSVVLSCKGDFVMSRSGHRVEAGYALVRGGACNRFVSAIRYKRSLKPCVLPPKIESPAAATIVSKRPI